MVFGLIRAAIDEATRRRRTTRSSSNAWNRHCASRSSTRSNHAMFGSPAAIYLTGYFYWLRVLAVLVILILLYFRGSSGQAGCGAWRSALSAGPSPGSWRLARRGGDGRGRTGRWVCS